MYRHLFNEFLASCDSLQVYEGSKLIFASTRDKLLPLMDYIDGYRRYHQQVVTCDKMVGNAAALLSVLVNCREVCNPLGSRLALATLDKYHIRYHLTEIIPYIRKPDSSDMCPMEKLSIGMDPEKFYAKVKNFIGYRK